MSTRKDDIKAMLRAYDRSPRDEEGWARVSHLVWPLISDVPDELLEKDEAHMRCRITEKGRLVLEYA